MARCGLTRACTRASWLREIAPKLLTPHVTIRAAGSDDLAALVEIERAAGEYFRSLGMDLVADDDPGSVEELTLLSTTGAPSSRSTPTIGRSAYERLGVRYVAPDEETPGLRAIRERERAAGLDAWPRASMSRMLTP
jgi:hypothetical protein